MLLNFTLITLGFTLTVTTSFWAARRVPNADPFLGRLL